MDHTTRKATIALGALLAMAGNGATAHAADPPPKPEWTITSDLSYVRTGGNAESSTFGLKLNVERKWAKNRFYLLGGGIRSSSSTISYFVTGPSDTDFSVTRVSISVKTAENYIVDSGYEHAVSDRFYWTVGAGWERNVFAGIDSRFAGRSGVGYAWSAADPHAFKTALLLSYTHQSETVPDPATNDDFVGVRATADFTSKFGPDGRNNFKSLFALDENLQTTEDLRFNWLNSLAVAMNNRFALQVGFLATYDNLPSLVAAPRFLAASADVPIGPPVGTVLVPLKKWDTQFTVSVVINLTPKPPVKMCPCP
jgi:hypothetical protein